MRGRPAGVDACLPRARAGRSRQLLPCHPRAENDSHTVGERREDGMRSSNGFEELS